MGAEEFPENGGRLSREAAQRMNDHDLLVRTAVTVDNLAESLSSCQQAHSEEDTQLWTAVNDLRGEVNQAKGGLSILKWVVGFAVALPASLLGIILIMQMMG